MHSGLFRNSLVIGLVVVVLLCVFTMGNVVQGATIYLQDIDSGLTSPTGNYRWLDVANQAYSSTYQDSYNYTQANVTVTYSERGHTLKGTLRATNLKPNFAYQLKLAGTPNTTANERIGLGGRWWEEEWIGGEWTSGNNLNNKGDDGSPPNPNDITYFSRRNLTTQYRYTGYLVFDYFITDENGNATLNFEANSSYHVLWKSGQEGLYTRTNDDGPIKSTTFDADTSSPAYDVDYSEQTIDVFGEWERLPVGGVFLQSGDYESVQIIITEESFHGSGGTNSGGWAAAMGADIPFTIEQRWYLSNESGSPAKQMYKDNTSRTAGTITLTNNEFDVWRADEPSQGVGFPAGNWTITLVLASAFPNNETFNVSLGTWNGSSFTSRGSHQFTGDGTTKPVSAKFHVDAFTVPAGEYLAITISNPAVGSGALALKVGQYYSSFSSPESDPGYPLPELQSWMLFVTGIFLLFLLYRNSKRGFLS